MSLSVAAAVIFILLCICEFSRLILFASSCFRFFESAAAWIRAAPAWSSVMSSSMAYTRFGGDTGEVDTTQAGGHVQVDMWRVPQMLCGERTAVIFLMLFCIAEFSLLIFSACAFLRAFEAAAASTRPAPAASSVTSLSVAASVLLIRLRISAFAFASAARSACLRAFDAAAASSRATPVWSSVTSLSVTAFTFASRSRIAAFSRPIRVRSSSLRACSGTALVVSGERTIGEGRRFHK
eukprot:1181498-Prymnesium_polylepis.1